MSDTTAYDPAELTAALLRHARGDNTQQAALTLLAEHDYWLRRIALHHPELVHADDGQPFRLNWIDLAKAYNEGELYASTSQTTILRVALSIQVYGFGVNLGDVLPGLDRTNTRAVLRAIATAAGHRDAAPTEQ